MDDRLTLIKRAKKGDVDAFTELYRGIYKRLYQYALYTLGKPEDAEDAVSEAVLDAFDSIKKLRSEEAFDTWIFRILHAKCNRKISSYYDSRKVVDFDSYLSSGQEAAETQAVASMETLFTSRVDLERAIGGLFPMDREIITLHVIYGYTFREVAAMMGLNENTVRSRESRALKKMRAGVKEVM